MWRRKGPCPGETPPACWEIHCDRRSTGGACSLLGYMCSCLLAGNDSRERPALTAATLLHFPFWNAYKARLLVHVVGQVLGPQAYQSWERTQSKLLETALRAWGVVQADSSSPLSTHPWQRQIQQRWTLHIYLVTKQKWTSWVDSPLGAVHRNSIPWVLQFHIWQTKSWSHIWDRQVLGEVYHRGSPGSRLHITTAIPATTALWLPVQLTPYHTLAVSL